MNEFTKRRRRPLIETQRGRNNHVDINVDAIDDDASTLHWNTSTSSTHSIKEKKKQKMRHVSSLSLLLQTALYTLKRVLLLGSISSMHKRRIINALSIITTTAILILMWSQWTSFSSNTTSTTSTNTGTGSRQSPIITSLLRSRRSEVQVVNNIESPHHHVVLQLPPTWTVPFDEMETFYNADYGGLSLEFNNTNDSNIGRTIQRHDAQLYEMQRFELLNEIDDPHMDARLVQDADLDFDQDIMVCRRTAWGRRIHPVCNTFHELSGDLQEPPADASASTTTRTATTTTTVDYLSHGYFRDSWLYYQPLVNASDNANDDKDTHRTRFALKTLRMQRTFDYDTMNLIEVEAIVMERLTASSRIVDTYGHCGTSLAAEYMPMEITQTIVPGESVFSRNRGHVTQQALDALQETSGDVHPMNSLTIIEKLDLAVVMAESMADIHGFPSGAIVHGDVHPDQWLRSASGQVKLNDFNNGMILEWSPANNSYCNFYTGYGGTYKAPEELRGDFVGAPADVWAMGNGIYGLLTGLYPYYAFDADNEEAVQQQIIGGLKPFVDDRYRSRSLVERRLVEIMEQCWALRPEERVDIFQVVEHLHETVRLYHQQPQGQGQAE